MGEKRKRSYSETFEELELPIRFISDMREVVDCIFLVHRSLSYLDLETGEYSNFKYNLKTHDGNSLLNEPVIKRLQSDYFRYLKVFITEEDCKKYYAPNRYLLYVLHLDVCKELDLNLRTTHMRNVGACHASYTFINNVHAYDDVYDNCFDKLVTEALKSSDQKVKLLSRIRKLPYHLIFLKKNDSILNEGPEILCSEGADIKVLEDFMYHGTNRDAELFHLEISMESLELFLRHANTTRYDLRSFYRFCDPIHSLIREFYYPKADLLFEYLDAPRFCKHTFEDMQSEDSWLASDLALQQLRESGPMTEGRCLLIMEILYTHCSYPQRALKTLQKVWRSIPDSFVTIDEITTVLSGHNREPTPEALAEMGSYLKEVTGEDVLRGRRHQPRKLKHHCRMSIRRVLFNQHRQLPTGIDQLKLPPPMKSFLKLES